MGNRTTPSYVAFTDTERLIGDAAKSQVLRCAQTVPATSCCPQYFVNVFYINCAGTGRHEPHEHSFRRQEAYRAQV